MLKILPFFMTFCLTPSLSWGGEPIQGVDLLTQAPIDISFPNNQKTVLIFMSAQCPCSGSHEPLIKALAEKFTQPRFLVIHSNVPESAAEGKSHFQKAAMGVSVLRDEKTLLADRFKALKTPHAFILDESGQVIYQGGVTDSHVGPQAKKKYLEEVLQDLSEGKKPRRSEGRALGCYIQRENS